MGNWRDLVFESNLESKRFVCIKFHTNAVLPFILIKSIRLFYRVSHVHNVHKSNSLGKKVRESPVRERVRDRMALKVP